MANAAPLTLDQVLARAGDGTGAANAELEARYAAHDQRQSEAGWEVFGNATAGRYRELVTEDLRNDYYGRSFAVGVRHPLLGTLKRRLDAVQASERDARLGDIQRGFRRAQQRLAVRAAYADWWRASQEQALCEHVQRDAQAAERQVQERLAGKWILPSDAQLMHSEWTAVTRRCDSQAALLEDVRASLQSLGVDIQPGDTPVATALPSAPQPLRAWADKLAEHPRMLGRDADVSLAEANRKQPWYNAIDAYFSVAQTLEQRSGAGDNGSGLSAGLTLSAPVDLLDYGSARSREGEARYQAAVRAQEQEKGELLRELGKVLAQQRRAIDEYQWRTERRTALREIVQERGKRGRLDAGEASLRLLQAEVDDYNAGFAQVSAWHQAWLEEAALRLFGDDSPEMDLLLGNARLHWQGGQPQGAAAQTTAWNQSVYVWNSTALLDPSQQAGELAALERAGIGQLNLGLNSVQIAAGSRTQAAVAALLEAAHQRNLRVNLLLGDPSWIKPSQRAGLVGLIHQLSSLPFDGLHLDLEVEQLGWPVPDQRLRAWLQTLREAKAASPWPVAISSHPRWFSDQASRSPCVPCELQTMGVNDISLMIYTRNPASSSRKALAIAKRWPQLHWRLAQSVEADQPRDLSWAGATAGQLNRQAANWRSLLSPAGVQGIDWQSWTDYPRTP